MQATQKALFEKKATGYGTYHRSSTSKASLRHYLRGCATTSFKTAEDTQRFWESDEGLRKFLRDFEPGHFKRASIGGEQEQGFEQAFSSLAYAYLKDKSPRLLDFIVGFQLVDRNEDNTKAMGVFGFKVGDQWLYAPVFFLNGDLKGHELLYIKKQDAFVPMKENWVNYLISRKPHVLGKGSDKNTFELGGLMPNLSRLSRPPTGTKYGADALAPVHMDEWAQPAMPVIAALALKRASALYPERVKDASTLNFKAVIDTPFKAAFAATAEQFDLRNFLAEFPLLKSAFENCYLAYPLIKKGFDRFYGPDFFQKMATTQRDDTDSLVTRAAKEARFIGRAELKRNAKKRKKKASDSLIPEYEAEPFNKDAGLTIYALDVNEDVEGQIEENKPELTDEEREKLLKDTVLIKDKRDSTATSIAYNTQVRLELSNPDATGLYDVLEKPGTFDEMLVISNPHTGRGREDFCLVVRKSDPRSWKNTTRQNLWAKQNRQPTDTDYKKWTDGLGGTDSLKKGGTYIAVHENGSGTCPFRIKEDYGDGAYKVEWHDDVSYMDRPYHMSPSSGGRDWDIGYSAWNAKLRINNRKGSHLRSVNGELSIPDSFKIIKVEDPPKPKKDKDSLVSMCCGESPSNSHDGESAKAPIQPGNLVDVQLLIQKEAKVLKIHDTGANEVYIKSALGNERMSKKAALLSLIRDHGFREIDAREMLKQAAVQSARNVPANFFVKYGYGYADPNLQPGPGAPAFPEPTRGMEQHGPNSTPSIYPQEEFLPVPGMDSNQTDPGIYDPFYTPDQNSMQVAQQASNSGQKEVFDTAMISGMLKSVRQDSLVDRYLGDLMKALDKLGRIIFMFYWHSEEFEDRYGKQDLPELEDALRNSFETLGDCVLFLKEKTVQGQSGVDFGSGVGKGEPSVEESARN